MRAHMVPAGIVYVELRADGPDVCGGIAPVPEHRVLDGLVRGHRADCRRQRPSGTEAAPCRCLGGFRIGLLAHPQEHALLFEESLERGGFEDLAEHLPGDEDTVLLDHALCTCG